MKNRRGLDLDRRGGEEEPGGVEGEKTGIGIYYVRNDSIFNERGKKTKTKRKRGRWERMGTENNHMDAHPHLPPVRASQVRSEAPPVTWPCCHQVHTIQSRECLSNYHQLLGL